MRVRVTYRSDEISIDEELEGPDAEAIVRLAQQRAAARAGFLIRMAIRAMSPLQFACEVVKLHNKKTAAAAPLPASCAEFLETARAAGILTVLEDEEDRP